MRTRLEWWRVIAVSVLCSLSTPADAAELSAGGYHAVRVDRGAVIGLGDGTYGQLGASPSGAPATVAGLSNVTGVASGGFSTLALKSDGSVWFLGETTVQHTTAHGTPNPVATPVQVPGLAGIDAIAAGHRHYLALDADTGNLYAWGHNGSGQVGNGSLLDVATPVVALTGVSTMDAGDGFSLAVKSDGTLWAWGRNTHGQLGLGDTADRLTPTQVPSATDVEAVAAGGQHSLVLLTGQTVLATGNNEFGQLGIGTTISTSSLTPVPGLSGITTVSAGYFHSAALDSNDVVSVWGRNYEGQCGGGSSSAVTYVSPQVLAGLADTPLAIACGYHFTLVELADGSVAGTGSNSDGQLDGSSVADQDDSRKILAPQATPLAPDLNPPQINSLSPANGASGVAINTALSVTLNKNVQKGTGSIRIKESLANAVVATINVNSASVTVNNPSVSIGLPANLENGTSYYVEIDPGALSDLSGNPFGGIAGSSIWNFTTALPTSSGPGPIAHWKFDDGSGTTAVDSAGTNDGTLVGTPLPTWLSGGAAKVGGALEFGGVTGQQVTASVPGLPTGNSPRTISLWLWADANVFDSKFFSYGTTASGTGFSWTIEPATTGGAPTIFYRWSGGNRQYTGASVALNQWNHVAIVVPEGATTTSDVLLYLNGSAVTTGVTTNNKTLNTGFSSLVLGGPNVLGVNLDGRLDDIQIYDTALSASEINTLFTDPGTVIGTPVEDFAAYVSDPAFGLAPGDRGFGQDPDGDKLDNGLEAWFGTHPGQFDAGLANLSTDGTTTTFTHPQNATRPTDVNGFYEWSPNLLDWYAGDGEDGPPGGPTVIFSAETIGATTTVTATSNGTSERLFFRAGAQEIP